MKENISENLRKRVKEHILVHFDEKNNLQTSEYIVVKKNWGSEIWIVNNEKYCAKILTIEEGKMCSVHYHNIKDEVFHIISGYVRLELWHDIEKKAFRENTPDRILTLWPGASIHIAPKTAHRFTGMKDSQMFEISTTHREEDSVRIVPSPT